MDEVECLVVGAGAIGLAVARALALAGKEVLVLEAEDQIGTQTSSRNSEVIHAGIYYPKDSLKARLCLAGRERLYDYCRSRSIAHRRCGKLIVATSINEIGQLENIQRMGRANGVEDLAFLETSEALALEPALTCAAALISPSTGIFDSHAYMLSLLGEAEDLGVMVAHRTPLKHAEFNGSGFAVRTGGREPFTMKARQLVNAAGLQATQVAGSIYGLPSEFVPASFYARGNYFSLADRAPFSRLIYPVPEPGGLGIHLTLDLAGQARFGPDVEWVSEISYDLDPRRGRSFYESIRRYWPGLRDGALYPAYCGIRPKLSAPSEPSADFEISGPGQHGLPGLVNLFGIESPGLTASLALADEVVEKLDQ